MPQGTSNFKWKKANEVRNIQRDYTLITVNHMSQIHYQRCFCRSTCKMHSPEQSALYTSTSSSRVPFVPEELVPASWKTQSSAVKTCTNSAQVCCTWLRQSRRRCIIKSKVQVLLGLTWHVYTNCPHTIGLKKCCVHSCFVLCTRYVIVFIMWYYECTLDVY